ncbi:T-complex protein 11-like protein 1 isoform X2 [Latimeria chalumnae]|uniref:T-complex protein 11-like protein 1 isoform X2 n=1 Tax=Latimeria chalumnae TaxID=7897 RepID=UPI00313CF663
MSQDPDKSQNSKQNVNDSESKSQADGLDTSGELIRKRIRQSTPSPHRGNTPQSGSPPRFVSLEELMETAEGVTNMTLAHEIVVNGDFQIKPTKLPEGSLEKRVRDIVHKAFWDCLEAQLNEDPPTYDHTIRLLGEIKETLLSFLLPGHTRLRNQINEVLDLELIKQEAENGALDISRLAEFIIGMMGTLCAPVRDEEIKKLRDIREFFPLLRAIFSVLDLMKMDMANFALSSIRPHLMQQSVEYERKKFQQFLLKQPNSLDVTTEWLEESVNDVMSETEVPPSPSGAAAAASRVSHLCPTTIQNQAYLRLLKWDHLNRPFPETILMDQIRFQEMQIELDQLTITAAVLLVIYNIAGSVLSGLPGFMDKLKNIIKPLLTGMASPSFSLDEALATLSEKICEEVKNCLSQHGFTPFSADKEQGLKGQIMAVAKPDNSIRKVLALTQLKSLPVMSSIEIFLSRNSVSRG